MRRYLVLTTESARHPFRAGLPSACFVMAADEVPAPEAVAPEAVAPEAVAPPAPRAALGDLGFFVMSFVSGFIIIFGMIV